MMQPTINIVIPLYNEQEVLPLLISRLNSMISTFGEKIEVILVDDGSTDSTRSMIKELCLQNPSYIGVFLSRNYGHQIALSAGLSQSNALDAVMVIDGDLQDPPELLEKLYSKLKEGNDVVYAIRRERKEGIIKKFLYAVFYRIAKRMSKIELPLDSGDFALLSSRVVDIMNNMPEESRYLRGMRSWIGFKQVGIEYERQSRVAGEAKYSFKMLFELAYNGIFNFSELPIKFVSKIGFISIGVSLLYFFYTLFARFYFGHVPSGFTALLFVIIMFGGVQLISIGIIGEYIIRIFFQVKQRPLYLIDEIIKDQKQS